MNREKQIEEMAKTMCFQADSCTVKSCVQVNCEKTWLAEALYTAGYRKSSEVAREIFEEIEKQIGFYRMCMHIDRGVKGIVNVLAELKKKYTEEGK